ncbi:MAG: NAD(P)-dependent oxidoreductase [Elusimicrobia bacterium]|nr:NAD(P)-dependent oxidoreductase [Elusimicrobiota bacterium]
MKTVAITGASGYLGRELAARFEKSGWRVLRLVRRPTGAADEISCDLAALDEAGTDALADALSREKTDALVHCAYDFALVSPAEIERVNVKGSLAVLEAARRANIPRFVFVSSLSAFAGCRSLYGRAKLAVEAACAGRPGTSVVRPGLIYSKRPAGIVGKMRELMSRFPVIPLIGSGRQPHRTTHVDDLGKLIEALASGELSPPGGPIAAACPEPTTFAGVLKVLSRSMGRSVLFVPVPWLLAWLGLKTLELLGLRPGLRSDSVVSLVSTPAADDAAPAPAAYPFRALSVSDFAA